MSTMRATKKSVVYDTVFPFREACMALSNLVEEHFEESEWPAGRLPTYGEWGTLGTRLKCIQSLLFYVLEEIEAVNGLSCDYAASKYHMFAAENKEPTE